MSFTSSPSEQDRPSVEELNEILRAAAAGEHSAARAARLSDLDASSGRELWRLWQRIPVDARRYLVREMVELSESNVELNFARVLRMALDDPDAEVRALAVSGLWENESNLLLDQFLDLLAVEPEPVVRETLAQALGQFAYRCALAEVDGDRSERVRQALLDLFRSNESIGVRRRALESLAYFDDDEEVEELIAEAYDSLHHDLRVSALFAMGRNLADRWLEPVLEGLEDEEAELRFEAARASGEFGDQRAVDLLLNLVADEDREVQFAAITALGQIGGKLAVQALGRLARSDDEPIAELAREAQTQALQVNDPLRPGL
ncbi:MAG TPA: HEAT repeat domain-containing protein [Nitrolancea sp.]|nr:HEAT repeat domain-containing protein [Nitrolancea sp.]